MGYQYKTVEARFKKIDYVVGLFIIGALFILIVAIVYVGKGKEWFKEYNTYYIFFDQGYNLIINAEVKMLNTRVGKVKAIKITPKNKVKVVIAVLKEYADRIKTDSIATVASPTIIGGEYIAITAGSPKKPPIPDGGIIKSVPKKTLSDYVEQFKLMEKFNTISLALERLATLINRLQDPNGPLWQTLNNLQGITGQIKTGKGDLGRVIYKEEVVGDIKEAVSKIREASRELPAITQSLSKNLIHLEAILNNIEKSTGELPSIMKHSKVGAEQIPKIVEKINRQLEETKDIIYSIQAIPIIRHNLPVSEKEGVIYLQKRANINNEK